MAKKREQPVQERNRRRHNDPLEYRSQVFMQDGDKSINADQSSGNNRRQSIDFIIKNIINITITRTCILPRHIRLAHIFLYRLVFPDIIIPQSNLIP